MNAAMTPTAADPMRKTMENELAAARRILEAGEWIAAIDRDLSIAVERAGNLKAAAARLDDEAAQIDREAEIASQQKELIEKSVAKLEATLRESSERATNAGAELSAFDATLSAKQREADEIGQCLIDLINNLAETRNRQNAANNGTEIASIETRRDELNRQAEAARDCVRAMEEERMALADRFKIADEAVQKLTYRIYKDKRDLEKLTKDIEQLGQRKITKIEEHNHCLSEIADVEESMTLMTAEKKLFAAKQG